LQKDDLFSKAPYRRFAEFISPEADRFTLLCSVLNECSLPWQILKIEGKRHIAVPALPVQGALSGIFTAHYDRTPQSPGANDNGAAVFQLIETAHRILKSPNTGAPVLFIFTDGEELSRGESLRHQGSYGLGLYLKKNRLGNSPVFSFDACGTGDTLIISTTAVELLKNENAAGAETARQKVRTLRRRALEAARQARLEKVLLLPTPFSEDAGFLLAGMAAQTITVLPQSETTLVHQRLIPETWKNLNGPSDSLQKLTPEHWKKLSAFAGVLAEEH